MPCVLERKLHLEQEISVVLARGRDGSVAAFPPPKRAPARHSAHVHRAGAHPDGLSAEAMALATEVATALRYVGVLAVEMFVADGGNLFVNELAPGRTTADTTPSMPAPWTSSSSRCAP